MDSNRQVQAAATSSGIIERFEEILAADAQKLVDEESRLTALEEALNLARQIDDPERVCRAAIRMCNCYWARCDYAAFERMLQLLGATVGRTDNPRLHGSYCYLRVGWLNAADRYQEAEQAARECIRHWTAVGYQEGLAVLYDAMGSTALMRGQAAEALRYYQLSFENTPPEDIRSLALSHDNICLALTQLGRWEDAVESAYHGLALAEQADIPYVLVVSQQLLGDLFLRRDRPAKAIEVYRTVIDTAQRHNVGADYAREAVLGMTDAYLRQGDWAKAEQLLNEHERLLLDVGRPYWRVRVLTRRALTALAGGRIDEAQSSAREAVELAASHSLVTEEAEARRVLASVHATAGQERVALACLDDAARLLATREDSYELARVRMEKGMLLLRLGNEAEGRELLQTAGRVFRRLAVTAEYSEVSKALLRLELESDHDLALLKGVSGLVSLGLDPAVFVTRVIELMMEALDFSAGVLLVGGRPTAVVGSPDLAAARLGAESVEAVWDARSLTLPVNFQGRRLGCFYLDRPQPGGREPRSIVLDTLASLLGPMVQRLAEINASVTDVVGENQELASLRFGGVVGRSPAMRRVLAVVARVASTQVPVLIRGESGTGKELVARALHDSGPRAGRPFVAVNCAALPESLMEAELFGVESGTATGVDARRGRFEQAEGGTVFLDEIAEMSPRLQAKLLRVIQQRELERVGGRTPRRLDIRLVAATNADIGSLLAAGRFRADLYYRLNTVELTLPALRERKEDIPELVGFFIRRADEEYGRSVAGCEAAAMAALCNYDWPGNIRELQHVVERAVILARGSAITLDTLPPAIREGGHPRTGDSDSAADEADAALIRQCLEQSGWNVPEAARLAGYSRAQFYRLMRRYGISRPEGQRRRRDRRV